MKLPDSTSNNKPAFFDRPWVAPAVLLFIFLPALTLTTWLLYLFWQQTVDEKARAVLLIEQEKLVTEKNDHSSPAPPSQTLLEQMKYSHQLAIIKYPQLGVENSEFRKRFLRHLKLWKDSHDPRLDQPDWPKLLADVSEQDNDSGRNGLWSTPRPLYPYHARENHAQGSGYIKMTTDETGQVVTATMVKSTGSEELDANTLDFAKGHWKGPPNATTTIPITYRLE